MKWKGGRQSTNVEDRTDEAPPKIPEGAPMIDGTVWGGNKKKGSNTEFNPNDPAEVKVVKELGKKNITKSTPIPTPRPTDNGTHDNLVTPGKWKTKSK